MRAVLRNMQIGLHTGHITQQACRLRLQQWAVSLRGYGALHWGDLGSALSIALNQRGELDHYHRAPLNYDIERPAVTFQVAHPKVIQIWTGAALEATEAVTALEFAKNFRINLVDRSAAVGRPGRPLWIQPLHDDIEALISGPASSDKVKAVRDLIGAAHWRPGHEILAFVTRAPIRDIRFGHDGDANRAVGPTVIEAREHPRFRHWPWLGRPDPDCYGRTYHLDPAERMRCEPHLHGVQEAVLKPIPLAEMDACYYLGQLSFEDAILDDPDDEYLSCIGAHQPVGQLLSLLAGELEL